MGREVREGEYIPISHWKILRELSRKAARRVYWSDTYGDLCDQILSGKAPRVSVNGNESLYCVRLYWKRKKYRSKNALVHTPKHAKTSSRGYKRVFVVWHEKAKMIIAVSSWENAARYGWVESSRRRRPYSPGEIIKHLYTDSGRISPADLAIACGLSLSALEDIVYRDHPLTANVAERLAGATGTTKQYWLDLQAAVDAYDLEGRETVTA